MRHEAEATLPALEKNPDLALIAIELLAEAWAEWPDDARIIGLPVAISRERGFRPNPDLRRSMRR